MKNNRYKAVLFDFDYTLADSSEGVIASFNFALSELGFRPVAPDLIRETIGLPLIDAFRKLVGSWSHEQSDMFLRIYSQQADLLMTDFTSMLDSVPETIEALGKLDVALGIVSTKERYRIEAVLKREHLLEHFDVIVGGDDVSTPKPDPEGVLSAIGRLKVSSSSTLYVGDSLIDAETARRAGLPFIAVLTGVTSGEAFDRYDVYGRMNSLSELLDLME